MFSFVINIIFLVVITLLSHTGRCDVLKDNDAVMVILHKMDSSVRQPLYGLIKIQICSINNKKLNQCDDVFQLGRFKFSKNIPAFEKRVSTETRSGFELNNMADELLAKYPGSSIKMKYIFAVYKSENESSPLSPVSVQYLDLPSLDELADNKVNNTDMFIYRIDLTMNKGLESVLFLGIERKLQ